MRLTSVLIPAFVVLLGGCATIVNDPEIPVEFIPQGCASLECTARNKRGSWTFTAPGTQMIRRSDDTLHISCTSPRGKTVTAAIRSEMEGAKLGASVLFFDLGITDAITDKHRIYQSQVLLACS